LKETLLKVLKVEPVLKKEEIIFQLTAEILLKPNWNGKKPNVRELKSKRKKPNKPKESKKKKEPNKPRRYDKD
jgi:hypothetical protein